MLNIAKRQQHSEAKTIVINFAAIFQPYKRNLKKFYLL